MTWRGRGYRLRFRPSGVSDRIISIQRPSFRLRYSLSSLWILSITFTFRSSIKWSCREKCLATGFTILRCLMSDRWSAKRTWSAFSVSPTYWMTHRLHSIKYTTLLVPQSAEAFTRNREPVVVLLNTVPVSKCAHALECGCLHGLFSLYVSLCCMNVALTKRSLRLGGRRYATRGNFGSASFKQGICQWRIDGYGECASGGEDLGVTWLLAEWLVHSPFLDRGVNSWSRDILVPFSIPHCTLSPSWPHLIKCFLSSATRYW